MPKYFGKGHKRDLFLYFTSWASFLSEFSLIVTWNPRRQDPIGHTPRLPLSAPNLRYNEGTRLGLYVCRAEEGERTRNEPTSLGRRSISIARKHVGTRFSLLLTFLMLIRVLLYVNRVSEWLPFRGYFTLRWLRHFVVLATFCMTRQ